MATLSFPIDPVIQGRARLSDEQALEIYHKASLHDLGQWANAVAQRMHPEDYRTYVIDRNINYTNVCTAKCTFCAFRRDHEDEDSYTLSYEKIGEKLTELVAINGTQTLLQGGMNDRLPIECTPSARQSSSSSSGSSAWTFATSSADSTKPAWTRSPAVAAKSSRRASGGASASANAPVMIGCASCASPMKKG
jgi:hypothetical protein